MAARIMVMIVLEVVQGPDTGSIFPLPPGEPQLIGRSSEALSITDPSVSRRHAELTPDGDQWFLRDLKSSNGTFLNGRPLQDRIALHPGDEFSCGTTLFSVRQETAVEPVLPSRSHDTSAESVILPSPHSLEAARDHLRLVYRLTSATAGLLSAETILHSLVALVVEEFRPDRVVGLLMDDDGLVTNAIQSMDGEISTEPTEWSTVIVQHACNEKTGLLVEDADEDVRFSRDQGVLASGVRTALCAPMTAHGRVLGAILLESHRVTHRWHDDQLHLVTAAAEHAGLALLTAELMRSRLHNERLAATGQILASISHSVKNILQGLRSGAGAIELALGKGNIELAQEGWPILMRNLDRVYALTFNMLAWSRASHPEFALVQLESLVREAATLVEGACRRRKIELEIDVEADMPPIPLDEQAILQVLLNLLNNATEVVESKTGHIKLSAHIPEGGEQAVVMVQDNGPGIEPGYQEAVFRAFHSTKGHRGTGLGLAVTRKIITEHGGTVRAEDVSAGGTRFVISLPMGRDEDPGDTKAPRAIDTLVVDEDFDEAEPPDAEGIEGIYDIEE